MKKYNFGDRVKTVYELEGTIIAVRKYDYIVRIDPPFNDGHNCKGILETVSDKKDCLTMFDTEFI